MLEEGGHKPWNENGYQRKAKGTPDSGRWNKQTYKLKEKQRGINLGTSAVILKFWEGTRFLININRTVKTKD